MNKLSFGTIFLGKFTKTEQIKKKFGFQLANYWVFNKLAWVFGRKLLEFFRDPPWVIFEMSKKSLCSDQTWVSLARCAWIFRWMSVIFFGLTSILSTGILWALSCWLIPFSSEGRSTRRLCPTAAFLAVLPTRCRYVVASSGQSYLVKNEKRWLLSYREEWFPR